jgi:hypothetical protein
MPKDVPGFAVASAGGVVDCVLAGVVAVAVVAVSTVEVDGATGVTVAWVGTDVGDVYPGGGVISSANEQETSPRVRIMTNAA